MLKINNLTGFGGAISEPLDVTYVLDDGNGGNADSYTFTGVSIGTAYDDRYLVISAILGAGTGDGSTPTVTVDGNTADVLYRATDGATTYGGFFIMAKPTGTTADIVVTGGSGWDRCGINIWSVRKLLSPSPISTASDSTFSTNDLSVTMQSPYRGAIFLAAYPNAGTSGNATWTDAAEVQDTNYERNFTAAYATYPTSSSSTQTITVTFVTIGASGLLLAVGLR